MPSADIRSEMNNSMNFSDSRRMGPNPQEKREYEGRKYYFD